jgi:fibronectin type 3 domain-containing protein
VSLSWTASGSPGITGYNVYQGTVSGGPYTKLTSAPIQATQYTDTTVQSGNTYFYVVTSVNSSGEESAFSNQTAATIP